jgi:hypothetical protein
VGSKSAPRICRPHPRPRLPGHARRAAALHSCFRFRPPPSCFCISHRRIASGNVGVCAKSITGRRREILASGRSGPPVKMRVILRPRFCEANRFRLMPHAIIVNCDVKHLPRMRMALLRTQSLPGSLQIRDHNACSLGPLPSLSVSGSANVFSPRLNPAPESRRLCLFPGP